MRPLSGLLYPPRRAVNHLRASDPRLDDLINRVGPFRLEVPPRFDPFQALATSITYQQLNGRAAATILSRVKALFPGKRFPAPADVLAAPEADLRKAGLSRNKLLAIRDLSAKVLEGVVPSRRALVGLTDQEIVDRLTVVRGIGRWTVEMMLIFRLGRPDVLPIDDYGVRKGFTLAFGKRAMVAPAALAKHGERWRPYRSVASWYLWRALD